MNDFADYLKTMSSHAPGIAGVIVVVVLFLSHMRRAEDRIVPCIEANTKVLGACLQRLDDLRDLEEERLRMLTRSTHEVSQ